MITKKLLAVSCLFLALPICAMKRGSRVSRRVLASRSLMQSKHLNTVILSSKQKGQGNKIFVSSGVPINFITKRFLCTEIKEQKGGPFPSNWSADALCNTLLAQNKKIEKFERIPLLSTGLVFASGCCFVASAVAGYGNFFDTETSSFIINNITEPAAIAMLLSGVGFHGSLVTRVCAIEYLKGHLKDVEMLAKLKDHKLYKEAMQKYESVKNVQNLARLESRFLK